MGITKSQKTDRSLIGMGLARQRTGLADALFTTTQQRVLGLLFGEYKRSFLISEVITLAGVGSGAVQRELAHLADSGLITVHIQGNQKLYQVNPASPVYAELAGIVRKTINLSEPIIVALKPLADRILAAFIFGSIAKRSEDASSDIDLFIVSNELSSSDVRSCLAIVEKRLGRDINPTIYSLEELRQRIESGNAFVLRVLEQPKRWVVGNEERLAEVIRSVVSNPGGKQSAGVKK